jgi:hypothetical protein
LFFDSVIPARVILGSACNLTSTGTRGKLSTSSVDNSAENLTPARIPPAIQAASSSCLFFGHPHKQLTSMDIFLPPAQIPENIKGFVTPL